MQVQWDVSGSGQFDSSPMVTPGRQNFDQGGIYRLKLTKHPGRAAVKVSSCIRPWKLDRHRIARSAYLAHNAIPVQFTEEDFDQALAGNFVTKVIYLPDPEFQGLAVADVATLVSTRLDPGLDPIEEASRKGAILAVIRLGNKDMEVPGDDGYTIDRYRTRQLHGPRSGPAAYGRAQRTALVAMPQIGGYAPATMNNLPPGGMPADLMAGMGVPAVRHADFRARRSACPAHRMCRWACPPDCRST